MALRASKSKENQGCLSLDEEERAHLGNWKWETVESRSCSFVMECGFRIRDCGWRTAERGLRRTDRPCGEGQLHGNPKADDGTEA